MVPKKITCLKGLIPLENQMLNRQICPQISYRYIFENPSFFKFWMRVSMLSQLRKPFFYSSFQYQNKIRKNALCRVRDFILGIHQSFEFKITFLNN